MLAPAGPPAYIALLSSTSLVMLRLVSNRGRSERRFEFNASERMADTGAVQQLIEPEVKALGYELVRVAMTGGTSDPTLQVMAERPDTRQLDLGDCERISRRHLRSARRAGSARPRPDRRRLPARGQLARHRPAADPRAGLQRLGGPRGADRARRADRRPQAIFGHHPRPVEGDVVQLQGKDGNDYSVPFAAIANAKLLLTDKLIKATAPLSTEGADQIKTEG